MNCEHYNIYTYKIIIMTVQKIKTFIVRSLQVIRNKNKL